MDSMTLSFDVKGMINGRYLIAASAVAISAAYLATTARHLISKWLDGRNRAIPDSHQPKPSQTIANSIIEDYKVNV